MLKTHPTVRDPARTHRFSNLLLHHAAFVLCHFHFNFQLLQNQILVTFLGLVMVDEKLDFGGKSSDSGFSVTHLLLLHLGQTGGHFLLEVCQLLLDLGGLLSVLRKSRFVFLASMMKHR